MNTLDCDNQETEVYRHKRIVFGVISSPFLLNAALRCHLETLNEDPEFVAKPLEGFFVDDLVTGAETVNEAFSLYIKARDRLKAGALL